MIPAHVSVKEAAEIMGASEQFVRIGLQRGRLPIGTAVQIAGNNYTYHISAKLLVDYIGKEPVEQFYKKVG